MSLVGRPKSLVQPVHSSLHAPTRTTKGHSYNLCDAASRAMDRALHNVDYYYGVTGMAGLTIQHVVRNKQRFVRKLRILERNDFWDALKWLGGA